MEGRNGIQVARKAKRRRGFAEARASLRSPARGRDRARTRRRRADRSQWGFCESRPDPAVACQWARARRFPSRCWWRRATKGQLIIAAIVQRNVEMIIAEIARPGMLRRRTEVLVGMIVRRNAVKSRQRTLAAELRFLPTIQRGRRGKSGPVPNNSSSRETARRGARQPAR